MYEKLVNNGYSDFWASAVVVCLDLSDVRPWKALPVPHL